MLPLFNPVSMIVSTAIMLLAHGAVSRGESVSRHGGLNVPVVHNGITFEAWGGSDPILGDDVLLADAASPMINCSAGPLAVLVRISSCFSVSDVQAIDNWVNTSLADSSTPYYVNGTAIAFNYYARFANSTAACPTGAIKSVTSSWSQYLSFLKPEPTALITNPNAVISFARDNVDIGVLTGIAAYQLQFRVCSSTCTSLASEKVLTKFSDLNNYSPASIVRYFPCSLSAFGAVGLPYKDTIGIQQCVCVCPTATTRNGSNCVATSSTRDAMCPWSANTAGFKCSWAKPGALKLATDCKVAVPLPKDNAVSDGRVNKNDNLDALTDPKVTVVVKKNGSVSASYVQTWRSYSAQPALELDKLTFDSYGVFNLTITASDYYRQASCDGCIAIVDAYPPHAIQSCTTSSLGSPETNPANVTVANLQTAIDLEANFTAFSNDLNVVNNPASERADFKNRTMLDWFASSYTVLGADSPSCFHNFVLRDLLNTPSSTVSVLALDTVAMGKLQCKRCCSKQTILREYTYDYQCATPAANAVKTLAGNESCSLNHCIGIKGDALVDASAATTDGKPLAKIITCATIDSDCVYKASLGSLVAVTARWKAELPNQDNYLSAFNASNYVFWRYKVGASSWFPWDGSTELSLTNASVAMTAQAWTRCGLAKESIFPITLLIVQYSLMSRQTDANTVTTDVATLTVFDTKCSSGEAIRGFRFFSSSGANAYYSLDCASHWSLSGFEQKYTDWNERKASVRYLDRHEIDCGTNAVNEFQLETTDTQMRYKFMCVLSSIPLTQCVNFETDRQIHNGGKTFYLDRLPVYCPGSDRLLTKFLLHSDGTYLWYTVTCCRHNDVEIQYALTVRESNHADMNVSMTSLTVYDTRCSAGEAIQSLKLVTSSGTNGYYSLTCAAHASLSVGETKVSSSVNLTSTLPSVDLPLIDCTPNAIMGFQYRAYAISSTSSYQTNYDITCSKSTRSLTRCTDWSTRHYDHSNQAYFLDRLAAACSVETLMTKLQLHADSSTFWYTFTCCSHT